MCCCDDDRRKRNKRECLRQKRIQSNQPYISAAVLGPSFPLLAEITKAVNGNNKMSSANRNKETVNYN